MLIPWQDIAADTLNNLLEEYVSREGTDYGHDEYSFAGKVARVRAQLERGEAVLVYDPETQSCNILPQSDRSSGSKETMIDDDR